LISLLTIHTTLAEEPPAIVLSPLVERYLKDDLLTDEQRREAMIFHGQWDKLTQPSPSEELRLSVLRYKIDPATIDPFDDLLRKQPGHQASPQDLANLAEAHRLAGRPDRWILTYDDHAVKFSVLDRLHLAQVYEDLGQYDKAVEQLAPMREQLLKNADAFTTAEDLTAAAQAVVMLARLEGRPADDFHLANTLLSKAHEEADPLYWPAYVAEAHLLFSKGNPREAMDAIGTALSLNPKSSEAWYLLGMMRARFFDFDTANNAVTELRSINPEHPLADVLTVEIALRQKDIETAQKTIGPALERYPTHRNLLALSAAIQALAYDGQAMKSALERFTELAPGNPLAEFEVGQAYADARQYALAEPHLLSAIGMLPGWSEPQLTLGELYMQWGKIDKAAERLQIASSLDPFHKEITNLQVIVGDMLGYETVEGEGITVRFLPGIDRVLARDIAKQLGDMARVLNARLRHDPPVTTQIDIMPDDQHFAVRLTGMPEIWTIAACTGDVIAMTPPRPGPKRSYGAYNWLNVLGHEYVHVVNLSQTNNRVAHWFTEGCAVHLESTGRTWSTYTMLAEHYNDGTLFDYDDINWGFIRPTEPYHRALAYAQASWLIDYIEQQFGWDKVLAMLEHYQRGVGEHQTIHEVFGTEVGPFMEGFNRWAGEQIKAWGMSSYGVKPEDEEVMRLLSTEKLTDLKAEELDQAIAKHPNEPELLKLRARWVLASGDDQASLAAIKLYQKSRPVDPWADRELARLALKLGEADTAVASLLTLDRIEGDAPEYAVELSRVYRGRKQYDRALYFAERALLREPYNATYRETAATIAVQKEDLERAAFHVESLELLEPTREAHPRRLAVIYQRLGRAQDAEAAKNRADAIKLQAEGR